MLQLLFLVIQLYEVEFVYKTIIFFPNSSLNFKFSTIRYNVALLFTPLIPSFKFHFISSF